MTRVVTGIACADAQATLFKARDLARERCVGQSGCRLEALRGSGQARKGETAGLKAAATKCEEVRRTRAPGEGRAIYESDVLGGRALAELAEFFAVGDKIWIGAAAEFVEVETLPFSFQRDT